MTKPKGLHADRLTSDFSTVEKRLVEGWQSVNTDAPDGSTKILLSLFSVYCQADDPGKADSWDQGQTPHAIKFPIGKPTERDFVVAETVIQWLGMNVGKCFLQQCGFEYKQDSK